MILCILICGILGYKEYKIMNQNRLDQLAHELAEEQIIKNSYDITIHDAFSTTKLQSENLKQTCSVPSLLLNLNTLESPYVEDGTIAITIIFSISNNSINIYNEKTYSNLNLISPNGNVYENTTQGLGYLSCVNGFSIFQQLVFIDYKDLLPNTPKLFITQFNVSQVEYEEFKNNWNLVFELPKGTSTITLDTSSIIVFDNYDIFINEIKRNSTLISKFPEIEDLRRFFVK